MRLVSTRVGIFASRTVVFDLRVEDAGILAQFLRRYWAMNFVKVLESVVSRDHEECCCF